MTSTSRARPDRAAAPCRPRPSAAGNSLAVAQSPGGQRPGGRAAESAILRLARADAERRPLATPCLDRWRQTGAPIGTPLWRAACWEAAAHARTTLEGRVSAFARARAIVAAARGEVPS